MLAWKWPIVECLLADLLLGKLLADEVLAWKMLFDEVLLRQLNTIELLWDMKLLLAPCWNAIELN